MTTRILLATLLATGLVPVASAETIIALRDGAAPDLVSFDSAKPDRILGRIAITGLPTLPVRARPVAVDFRPNGGLYLLVQHLSGATDCALYAVSTTSGSATPVGTGTFTCPAVGDMDVDPRSDLVRVVAGTSNYRIAVGGFATPGTKSDATAVAYLAGDANEGVTPDIRGLGYNQNVASSPNTTLFGVDVGVDSLVRVGNVDGSQASADSGELTTLGGLGISVASAALDVSGATGTAFLYARDAAALPAVNGLYTVDLATGAATLVGKVGDGSRGLLGLTVVPGTVFLPPPPDTTLIDDGGALPLSLLGLLAALGWRRRQSR